MAEVTDGRTAEGGTGGGGTREAGGGRREARGGGGQVGGGQEAGKSPRWRAIAVRTVGGGRGRRAHISGPAGTDRSGTRPLAVHSCMAKSVVCAAAACSCPAWSTRQGPPRRRWGAHRAASRHPCASRCHGQRPTRLRCRSSGARRPSGWVGGNDGTRYLGCDYILTCLIEKTATRCQPNARLGALGHATDSCDAFAAACCRRRAGSSGLHSALQRLSGQ